MATTLPGLLELLDLETLEVDLFRGRTPETWQQRVFGGQVAAQALVAAGRTVPSDRPIHSLHAYFLRPGDPSVPIVYQVDPIRDGRSFTTRRVAARQHGQPIFHLSASFQAVEGGFDHQVTIPEVPGPETLESLHDASGGATRLSELLQAFRAIDLRHVPGSADGDGDRVLPGHRNIWVRVVDAMPDDQLLHVCVLAYLSDLTLLGATLVPHGLMEIPFDKVQTASLDHAMWFHRPFRADDWLLYEQWSPSASGARGLATGRIFTRDGGLAVSVVQEGLIRPRTSA